MSISNMRVIDTKFLIVQSIENLLLSLIVISDVEVEKEIVSSALDILNTVIKPGMEGFPEEGRKDRILELVKKLEGISKNKKYKEWLNEKAE